MKTNRIINALGVLGWGVSLIFLVSTAQIVQIFQEASSAVANFSSYFVQKALRQKATPKRPFGQGKKESVLGVIAQIGAYLLTAFVCALFGFKIIGVLLVPGIYLVYFAIALAIMLVAKSAALFLWLRKEEVNLSDIGKIRDYNMKSAVYASGANIASIFAQIAGIIAFYFSNNELYLNGSYAIIAVICLIAVLALCLDVLPKSIAQETDESLYREVALAFDKYDLNIIHARILQLSFNELLVCVKYDDTITDDYLQAKTIDNVEDLIRSNLDFDKVYCYMEPDFRRTNG